MTPQLHVQQNHQNHQNKTIQICHHSCFSVSLTWRVKRVRKIALRIQLILPHHVTASNTPSQRQKIFSQEMSGSCFFCSLIRITSSLLPWRQIFYIHTHTWFLQRGLVLWFVCIIYYISCEYYVISSLLIFFRV